MQMTVSSQPQTFLASNIQARTHIRKPTTVVFKTKRTMVNTIMTIAKPSGFMVLDWRSAIVKVSTESFQL